MSRLRYEIWTAPVKLRSLAPDHAPRPDLGMCGFWPCQALVGESGARYWLMLTIGNEGAPVVSVSDASVISEPGFRTHSAPVLIDGKDLRTKHRYEYSDEGDQVLYKFKTGHLRIDPRQYDWVDFEGAVNLHVDQRGDGVFFRIPIQDRIECPIYHQSQTGLVTGQIAGDPVFGLSLLDYVWSRPKQNWIFTEAFLEIERHWTMWLVEYEDGTFDGGYAWSAKPPYTFNAGHLIQNDVSSACQTVVTTATFGAVGLPERIHLDYGGQYEARLELTHQADWPLHAIGHVASTSNPKRMKRSIVVTEWVPDNIADLLYGRVPGCTSYADLNTFDSIIENHRVVPAGTSPRGER